MQLQRGLQFAPGYRLQEFLGRGQFGQVWRATAPGGTAAAVKFIDLSDGQGHKEYDGIRRVKQIRHANLMPIIAIWLLDKNGKTIDEVPDEAVETINFSVAGDSGNNFTVGNTSSKSGSCRSVQPDASWLVVAMLLGGQSLQQRLRECTSEGKRGIPTKELISYLDESAKGLDYLNSPIHDLGDGPISIQHCDVKPANIVLIGTSAVVCDFGLARILTRAQATATSASGTPAYMAPEAIEGQPSRTSDQYSLAITYYQLRTGALPVNEGSLWQILDAHRQGKLDFRGVPEPEQAVLKKATHVDWKSRFETNVEMVDALRDAIRYDGSQPGFFGGQATTDPHDQSRLTRIVAGSGGHSLTAVDPTATIGSEFLKSHPSTPLTPVANGLFGSPSLLETTNLGTSQESTEKDLQHASDNAFGSPPTFTSITLGGGGLWTAVTQWTMQHPRTALGSVGGMLLMAFVLLGNSSVVEPQPYDVDRDGNGKITATDPLELFNSAREAFARGDFESAKSSFNQAVKADRSLMEVQSLVMTGHQGSIFRLAVTPDSRMLVSLADDTWPAMWRLDERANRWNATPIKLEGHDNIIDERAFSFSPKNDRLLTGGYGGQAFVWNLNAKEEARRLSLNGVTDDCLATCWNADGTIAVASTAVKGGFQIWQLAPGSPTSPPGVVTKSKFLPAVKEYDLLQSDPTGQFLVAKSNDNQIDVYKWNDVSKALDESWAPKPHLLMASGDKARLLECIEIEGGMIAAVTAGESGVVTFWDVSSPGSNVARSDQFDGISECLAVVGDQGQQWIAVGQTSGSVGVWHRSTTTSCNPVKLDSAAINSVALTEDGKWLAAGSVSSKCYLMSTSQLTTPLTLTLKHGVRSLAFSKDNRWLFAGTVDGEIYVWDLVHAQLLALTQVLVDVPQPSPAPPSGRSVSRNGSHDDDFT
jgi:serine/threonine protein kinase